MKLWVGKVDTRLR